MLRGSVGACRPARRRARPVPTGAACARSLAPGDAELEVRILAAYLDEELRGVLETPVALACRACERVHEITDRCPLKGG